MVETIAAHKLAFLLLTVGALATVLYLRRRSSGAPDALAGVPATVYGNSQAAQSPDSFTTPAPGPVYAGAQQPPPPPDASFDAGPNTDSQTSSGPGAGPTVSTPVSNYGVPGDLPPWTGTGGGTTDIGGTTYDLAGLNLVAGGGGGVSTPAAPAAAPPPAPVWNFGGLGALY